MSGWGLGWFGGGQAKKDAPKKAILQLRQQLELLNKREKHLQNQMDEQDTLARKYVTSNKAGKYSPPSPTLLRLKPKTFANESLLLHLVNSGQGSPPKEEDVRSLGREHECANLNARGGNLQH